MNPNLSDLLKWSVENSSTPDTTQKAIAGKSEADGNVAAAEPARTRPIDAKALAALLGGPSDADLMREAMAVLHSSNTSLENKMIAFDNLEQLIENLDNANNLIPLGLWPGLASLLTDSEAQIRLYAAWCIGTAVQNNVKSQEALLEQTVKPLKSVVLASSSSSLAEGPTTEDEESAENLPSEQQVILERLVDMATESSSTADEKVKRKALYAISSAVRNFQPALDKLVAIIQIKGWDGKSANASEMDDVDNIIAWLRNHK